MTDKQHPIMRVTAVVNSNYDHGKPSVYTSLGDPEEVIYRWWKDNKTYGWSTPSCHSEGYWFSTQPVGNEIRWMFFYPLTSMMDVLVKCAAEGRQPAPATHEHPKFTAAVHFLNNLRH